MADSKKIVYEIEINNKGAITLNKTKVSLKELQSEFDNTTKSIKAQGVALSKTTKDGLNPMIDKTGLAGATVVELGRTISDSNYGIRGMANNLSQLSTLMITLITTTGGLANGMKALWNTMKGPLGLIIAFQIVIALLERFDMESRKSKGSAEGLSGAFKNMGSTVSDTAGNFETYVRTLQDSSKSQEQHRLAIDKLNKEFPDFVKNLNDAGYKTEDLKDKTNDLITITNQYRAALFRLAQARAAQNKIDELAGKSVDDRLKAEEEALKLGLTLDEARELSAQKDEKRTDKSIISIRKRTRNLDEFRTAQIDAADRIISDLDKENIATQELINKLMDYTIIELDTSNKRTKARKKESDEKGKYDALEIGNFDKKIRALKEMGQIRDYFFNKNLEMDVVENKNTIEAILLEEQQNLARLDALKELGLNEAELAVAKYEINLFYTKLLAKEQEQLDRQGYAMRMDMFQNYANSLGSLAGLMKENSEAAKTLALLEIAANTAIGFSKGLVLAQEQALSAPPVSTLAFPLFISAQIAAVLSAANRAKGILNGGSASGGITTSQPSITEAPDFNVVGASPESQLAQTVAGQQSKPLRAFVVGKDITNQQELDRNAVSNSSLG
jgi:hypothetical protein